MPLYPLLAPRWPSLTSPARMWSWLPALLTSFVKAGGRLPIEAHPVVCFLAYHTWPGLVLATHAPALEFPSTRAQSPGSSGPVLPKGVDSSVCLLSAPWVLVVASSC